MTDGQALTDAALLQRFVTATDGAAFAALVERHGPMVFAVCRQLLRDHQDAEDAFQATFLVLVRRAGQLRQRELLANWLYGVALRVARRARAAAARRRQREGLTADLTHAAAPPAPDGDLGPLVHEEVGRMPARYRGPVVLCYLQGLSNEEAARELACPVGTVKSRLSRARDLLRGRLERRGVTLSGCALTAALVASTAQAALPCAANSAAGGLVSAQAAALAQGVLRAMLWTKVKLWGVGLVACLLVAGVGLFALFGQGATPQQDGQPKVDAKTLLGKWQVVRQEATGKVLPEVGPDGAQLVHPEVEFLADKIVIEAKGKRVEMAYKINPNAKPPQIDLTHPDGGILKGIFQREKDTLKLCFAHAPDIARPTELTTKADTLHVLWVMEKGK